MRGATRIGDWTFAWRDESTTLSPDPDHATVFSFDLEGRPISWFEDGRLYKRSLASEVHGREQIRGPRRRFVVPPEEAAGMFERILRRVAGAPIPSLDGDLRARLLDILRWTPESLLDERRRFEAAYRPVSILPPDQYLAVVLQATFGCSWNRCTYCDFYQDSPFRARTVQEFASHAHSVKSLLGRGESLRKRIFLADGNALILSSDRLHPLLEVALREFPGRAVNGFVDVFNGERRRREDWAMLRDLGLERVHVGVETGHDPLLLFMNKPGSAEEALNLVATLKAAGLSVAVIVMCGVGGDRHAAAHESDTARLLTRAPLGAGDIVYLSPFVEHPGSVYASRAREAGVLPLDDARTEEQYARLRDAVRRTHPGVRASRYDIREFIY